MRLEIQIRACMLSACLNMSSVQKPCITDTQADQILKCLPHLSLPRQEATDFNFGTWKGLANISNKPLAHNGSRLGSEHDLYPFLGAINTG